MIQSDDIDPAGDDDSDEEQDLDAADEEREEEPMTHDDNDHGFLTKIMDSFIDKISMLKSRAGRAGLVHNFLRGLQLMSAPVPSGELLLRLFSLITRKYRLTFEYRFATEPKEVTDAADELAFKTKRIYLVDSGLVMNSPYPMLLRPQREVDIFLSFDFSARDKDDYFPFQVRPRAIF